MEDFTPGFADLKLSIDDALDRVLHEREHALPEAAPLIAEIARMAGAGGKRLRPAFCYWGFRAAGGEHSDGIVTAASALELLHTFALVHDDIMDSADTRRGIPSVHAKEGLDAALLVGDLALVLADHALLSAGFDAGRLLRALHAYSRMRQEVIAGQFLDTRAREDLTEETARRIARLKSGRYSVQEPLVIGARLAGGDDRLQRGLERFGAPLGEAFQLRDDILGTFGADEVTGKPVDSDIRQGKHHLLFARAAAGLNAGDRDFVLTRWGGGRDLSDRDVDRLRSLVESSGARSSVEETIARLVDDSAEALRSLDIPRDAALALEMLIELTVARES